MASRSMLLFVLAAAVLAVSSYADQDLQFISQEAVSSTPLVKPAPTPSPSPSPPAKPSPSPLVKPVPTPSPPPPPYKKPPTPTPSPAVPKPPTHSPAPAPSPVPVPKPPTAAPSPVPSPSPFVKSIKDCSPLCANRCKLHSRPNRCNRACVSCCSKCKCVPPGTYGNREQCGTCYTGLTTKFDKPKCP